MFYEDGLGGGAGITDFNKILTVCLHLMYN
jgi:hypothetical protein